MLNLFKEIINEIVATYLKSKGYTQETYQASNDLEADIKAIAKAPKLMNFCTSNAKASNAEILKIGKKDFYLNMDNFTE